MPPTLSTLLSMCSVLLFARVQRTSAASGGRQSVLSQQQENSASSSRVDVISVFASGWCIHDSAAQNPPRPHWLWFLFRPCFVCSSVCVCVWCVLFSALRLWHRGNLFNHPERPATTQTQRTLHPPPPPSHPKFQSTRFPPFFCVVFVAVCNPAESPRPPVSLESSLCRLSRLAELRCHTHARHAKRRSSAGTATKWAHTYRNRLRTRSPPTRATIS